VSLRTLAVLAAAWLACSATVRADTINLTNGRSLKGRIVGQTKVRTVVLLDNGVRLTIPADQIESIEPEAPKAALELEQPPEKPAAPEKAPEPAKPEKPAEPGKSEPPAAPPEDPEAKKQAAETAARVARLVELLGAEGADNAETRESARAQLVAIGEPGLGALCAALEDKNAQRRLLAATALGEAGAKGAVGPLLAAVYASTPQTGNLEPWAIQFLNVCAVSLEKITGQNFGYNGMYAAVARGSVERMLEWWGKSWKEYPPQVGAPRPDPARPDAAPPDPVEAIRKLPFRSFPQPAGKY
jgi:hypothetical protein